MSGGKFKTRTLVVLSFLLIWAVVSAAHIFYYSVIKRDSLIEEVELLAWREADVPAVRGRILDKNGVPLAWTTLKNDLIIERVPSRKSRADAIPAAFERVLGKKRCDFSNMTSSAVVAHSLTPDEIVALDKTLRAYPELRVIVRMERCRIDYPEVRKIIGRTAYDTGGRITGIDGYERDMDAALSGKDGRFVVMLDKAGNWFEGTLKIIEQPLPGADVKIPLSISDIVRHRKVKNVTARAY